MTCGNMLGWTASTRLGVAMCVGYMINLRCLWMHARESTHLLLYHDGLGLTAWRSDTKADGASQSYHFRLAISDFRFCETKPICLTSRPLSRLEPMAARELSLCRF